jgi:hypothetical protein
MVLPEAYPQEHSGVYPGRWCSFCLSWISRRTNGTGGGIVLVPILMLMFGIDIRLPVLSATAMVQRQDTAFPIIPLSSMSFSWRVLFCSLCYGSSLASLDRER